MLRKFGLALIGSLLLAGSAAAQTADDGAARLPSIDKKHVETLYQGQDFSGTTLTREQIASYRSEGGWGKAFKEMQADGYFKGYKNFGQVVSGSKLKAHKAHKAHKVHKVHKVHKAHKLQRVTRVNRPNRPKRPKRR